MNPVETSPKASKTNGTESQLLHPSLFMMTHAGDTPKGPPALSATPTIGTLLQSLRRRWPVAFGAAILAAAAAVAAVFIILPPKYNVAMRLRVAKQPGIDENNHIIFTANMEALVKSPLVLNSALNEKTADGREIKDLDIVRSRGMAVIEWLEKTLKTDYKLGPEVLRVTLPADQPDEAAELLNAIAKAFFNEFAEMERAKKQARVEDLRGKKVASETHLNSLRKLLQGQFDALDVKDRDAVTLQMNQLMRKLDVAEAIRRTSEEELMKAQNEKTIASARLKGIDKEEIPDDVLQEALSRDPLVQAYDKRILEIDDEVARVRREFAEPVASQKAAPFEQAKNDAIRQRDEKAKQVKPSLEKVWRAAEAKALRKQIEFADLKRQEYAGQRDRLLKEIHEIERKVKEAGPTGVNVPPQIQATLDKIDLEKISLNQTVLKISEVELENPASRIMSLQTATAPLERDHTQQAKIAGAGGFGMFFLALFGVAYLEFRSRKIGGADEVADGLGLKVIGTVPALPARPKKQDAAAAQQWHEYLHESVDAIRTVFLHQARTEALHVLMITSASSGEGKTTLASQLAASLARAWKRVLLIDGDLRHPAAHSLFDVPQEPGLAELLRGEVEPGDAVRATAFSRLWILPAGNGDAHAIQALAQDNVRSLFEQLKQQYDFIIIDAPPVLPVTDALLLGQHVDRVVFAVLQDVSRAPAIHAAQKKLDPLGVPTLGAVVLGTESQFEDGNYRLAWNAKK